MIPDAPDIIRDVVRAQLPGAVLRNIEVEEDTDTEGDSILRITVIFDREQPDVIAMTGLARYARSRLNDAGEDRFPVFRFISATDAKERRPAV